MGVEIFPDPVEHHNGSVYGIPYNGQQSRHKGGVDFQVEHREPGQGHQHVNDQGYNGRQGEPELKPDGDVDDHQHPAEDYSPHGAFHQVAAYGGSHVFHPEHFIFPQAAGEIIHHFHPLAVAHKACTDQHRLAAFHLLVTAAQLDHTAAQLMVAEYAPDLGYSHRLFELDIQDAAPGEIDSQVEAPGEHGNNPYNQYHSRNGKEDPGMLDYGKLFHRAASPFPSFVFG